MSQFSSVVCSSNQRRSKLGGVMEGEAKGGVDSISSIYTVSSESDSGEEVVSSVYASSSPFPPASPPIQKQNTTSEPLLDMSPLLLQLPIKRGLSKHYQGKSQSFASLSEVTCMEDLAKPENPTNKRLKLYRSYEVIAENTPKSRKTSSSRRIY